MSNAPPEPARTKARDARRRFTSFARTIRARIILSCVAMGIVTGLLGAIAGLATFRAGRLVSDNLDNNLTSINAVNSASGGFLLMREAFVRRSLTHPESRVDFDRQIDGLRSQLAVQLATVARDAHSAAVDSAAAKLRLTLKAWDEANSNLADHNLDFGELEKLNALSAEGERAFTELARQVQEATVSRDRRSARFLGVELVLILAGTTAAILLPALIGWLLARRTVRPIAAAVTIAERIANGQFEDEIPDFGDDELGAMLGTMARMQTNIRAIVDREIALRRSAQTRLADALESSHDGIIVVDADLRIALANGQAADFLGVSPATLAPGAPVTHLTGASRSSRKFLLDLLALEGRAEESLLADGRWLRVSRSWTRDGGFIALCSDISLQKHQESALKATNLRLDAALENMSQGLCLFGADQTLHVVNRRFTEIFGLRPDAVCPGMSLREIIARLEAAGHFPDRSAEEVYVEESRFLNARAMRFLQIRANRIVGVATEVLADGGWLATYEDVTERRQAEERIAFMARHDALTGLPNRVLFAERSEQAIVGARRGRGCAVFCLDLDRFKNVNDTLGHPIGDELLRTVAKRIQACVRETDTVARLGGDEFAVVQIGIENPEEAVALANRIVAAMNLPFQIEGHSMSVGVSIGISLAPEDGSDHGKLMKNADVALYRAKEDGRGTWRFFEAEMDSRLQARREMELDLRRGLDEQQFEVYYQPQFDLRLDRISGFEALVRWRHPTRGMVSPADFIPLAEEIGLIREIGAWVLRTACIEASRWPSALRVAVNVSPIQLRHADFRQAVADALSLSGLEPELLELEITESVMLSNGGAALDLLHQIHDMGVQLAMDDFGTGYSSLTSLRSFPFDKIKIDRSFIKDLCDSPAGEPVVRAVIALGQGLGIRITAEGVESAEQLARLRGEGCTEVQGFLISPPRPASEIPKMLDRWNGGARRGLVTAVA